MSIPRRSPLPFGRHFNEWAYRLHTLYCEHPYRFICGGALIVAAIIQYDRVYTFGDVVYSPTLSTNLIYKMRAETIEPRPSSDSDQSGILMNIPPTSDRVVLDRLAGQVKTDREREELESLKQKVAEKNSYAESTMSVSRGQVSVRRPHWGLRMNERNWSVLARDQQHQQDEYWYRAERSREDDFGRNTYGKRV